MNLTIRIISRLLCYPDEQLQNALDEMRELTGRQANIPADLRSQLREFITDARGKPLFQWQEEYVALFDRGRYLSLHLFEHVHGESRDRGQAMVDLLSVYQAGGYQLDARELPDYLPLFLEYLSTINEEEIRAMISDAMPVMVLLQARLQEKGSDYSVLFRILEVLGGSCEEAAQLRRQVHNEEADETIEKMDEIWEEEQVLFMANTDPSGSAGCANIQQKRPAKFIPVKLVEKSPHTAEGRN